MNRTYELMFIVRPDMADEDLDKLISNLESTVLRRAGTVQECRTHGQAPSGLYGAQVPRRHLHFDDDRGREARWSTNWSAACA